MFDIFGFPGVNFWKPKYTMKTEIQFTWELPEHTNQLFKYKTFSVKEQDNPSKGDVILWHSHQFWFLGFRIGFGLFVGYNK
jgi:hypothetical protein